MTTIEKASAALCRARDTALTEYARQLLAAGADVEDKSFKRKMVSYANQLEDWRRTSMAEIQEYVAAATAQRDQSTIIH
jgi:hypothetical protein